MNILIEGVGGKLDPDVIFCDVEKAIHQVIRKEFKIVGCYFHLVKNWWYTYILITLKIPQKALAMYLNTRINLTLNTNLLELTTC